MATKRNALSDSDKTYIIHKYNRNVPVADIAKAMGRHVGTIYNVLRVHRQQTALATTNNVVENVQNDVLLSQLSLLAKTLSEVAPEVEQIVIEPKTRVCKILIHRQIEFSV